MALSRSGSGEERCVVGVVRSGFKAVVRVVREVVRVVRGVVRGEESTILGVAVVLGFLVGFLVVSLACWKLG